MPKVILIAEGEAKEIEFTDQITFGRTESNTVMLDGHEISRAHAVIQQQRGGHYTIMDPGSKNGVFLHGQKITSMTLGPGDEIHIGKYLIVFDPPNLSKIGSLIKKQKALDKQPINKASLEMTEDTDPISKRSLEVLRKASCQIFYPITDVEALGLPEASEAGNALQDILRMQHELMYPDGLEEAKTADGACRHFLDVAAGTIDAQRAVIAFNIPGSKEMRLAASIPEDCNLAVNRVVMHHVLKESQGVICNSVQSDERFESSRTVAKEKIGSMIAIPLFRGDKVTGLIYADVIEKKDAFRPFQLYLLHFLGRLLMLGLRQFEAGELHHAANSRRPTREPIAAKEHLNFSHGKLPRVSRIGEDTV